VVRPLGGIVIENKKEHLFIYNVVVAPKRQHQGVGRALLRFAEEGGPADRHGALLQGIPHCAVQLIDPAWAVSASQRFEIRDVHYKVRMRVFKFAQAGSIGVESFRVGGDLGNEHPLQNGREM
jgi:GNAT superfamily N-acetyltransferase